MDLDQLFKKFKLVNLCKVGLLLVTLMTLKLANNPVIHWHLSLENTNELLK